MAERIVVRDEANDQPKAERSRSPNDANRFERFSNRASKFAGSTTAFILALVVVVAWCVSGPFMHFSERWQLIINSITTIVTFLMVFLIQRAQNKDVQALQIKLDELLKRQPDADQSLIGIDEKASEEQLGKARDEI